MGKLQELSDAASAIRSLVSDPMPTLRFLPLESVEPIPGVPQEPIVRYLTTRPPSDVQEGFRSRARTVMRDVDRGVSQGAHRWYHNEPVRRAFVEELGDEAGQSQYDLFASMVAGSSSASDVRKNIQKASWYRQQALEGNLEPGIETADDAVAWLADNRPPAGYGSVASINDALWTSRFLSGPQTWRAAEPGAAHKILSFDQNLRGNLAPWTGDRHEAARLGVPAVWNSREKAWSKGMLTPNEYVAAERMMQRMAARAGLQPAELQSARWMGGAKATGVESKDPSFSHAFEAVLSDRAARSGQSPERVLRAFIRDGGLLSVPAALAGLLEE